MLSERSHSNHVPLGVVLENEFPVSTLRVHDHLVHDALTCGVCELLKIHIQDEVFLLIMSDESEIHFEGLGTVLRDGHPVGLLSLNLGGEDFVSGGQFLHLHLPEEVEIESVLVDTAELDLGALLYERDLDPLLHHPLGNEVAELLHEQLHHVVALGVDDQGSEVIEWGLLQIANDEAASVLCASLRHRICRTYPETGTHGEAKVSVGAVGVSGREDLTVQGLAEVDDGVLEVTIATRVLALTSSSVIVGPLGSAGTLVSHVLTTTVLTNLQVCVAVEFGEVLSGDSTLPMKAVHVLAYDEFEVVLFK